MTDIEKSVIISIHPEYCYLIGSGRKKVELRKSFPQQMEPPYKVYMYCTDSDVHNCLMQNEVGLELVKCDNYKTAIPCGGYIANGKIIGEFICNGYDEFTPTEKGVIVKRFLALHETCLSVAEVRNYLSSSVGYGWRIKKPIIYEKPVSIEMFGLSRPPQSWCYMRVEMDKE